MIVSLLSSQLRSWFDSAFPEWSLPSQVILKTQKEGWDEEFEMEKATYTKLRPLQGVIITKFLSEVRYNGVRALLLSDVGGACLATPEGALLELAEFRRMLAQALTALSHFAILHHDVKLDNFHVARDRIMVVDLERVSDGPLSDEYLEVGIESAVDSLARHYESNQYCFWEDGLIMIDTS